MLVIGTTPKITHKKSRSPRESQLSQFSPPAIVTAIWALETRALRPWTLDPWEALDPEALDPEALDPSCSLPLL